MIDQKWFCCREVNLPTSPLSNLPPALACHEQGPQVATRWHQAAAFGWLKARVLLVLREWVTGLWVTFNTRILPRKTALSCRTFDGIPGWKSEDFKTPECLGPLKVLTCWATSARNLIPKGWRLEGTQAAHITWQHNINTWLYSVATRHHSEIINTSTSTAVSHTLAIPGYSLKAGDFPIKTCIYSECDQYLRAKQKHMKTILQRQTSLNIKHSDQI